MRFLEILLGILLFPIIVIIGIFTGIFRAYEDYHTIFMISTKDDHL